MAYKVKSIKNKNYITDENNNIKYFRSLTSAHHFVKQCLREKCENYTYIPEQSPREARLETQIEVYSKEMLDIYHAIELSENDIELLRLARLLKSTLKNRRIDKSRLKNTNPDNLKLYKNRTNVLNKKASPRKMDKISNFIISKII